VIPRRSRSTRLVTRDPRLRIGQHPLRDLDLRRSCSAYRKNRGDRVSPAAKVERRGLEREPQRELNIATFVAWKTRCAGGPTLLRLDKGSRVRTDVQESSRDILVVVIQNIVKLAAELQAIPFSELKILVEVRVDVPESRSKELVPVGVGRPVLRVCAAYVIQARADRSLYGIAQVVYGAGRVGHLDIVVQVRPS